MVLAGVCAALAGCGPKGPPDKWAGLLHPSVLEEAGLEYYWQKHDALPLEEDEVITRTYLLDENLYFLTDRNRLLVASVRNGSFKWSATIAEKIQTVFGPTHANLVTLPDEPLKPGAEPVEPKQPYNIVAINSLNRLLVFDRLDGRRVRSIRLDPAANTGGALGKETFFVATARGWYYAIELREPVKTWERSTRGLVTAPVRYFRDTVFIASQDGLVYGSQAHSRRGRTWSQKTYAPITAAFQVDGRGCFVGSQDGYVYAYGPSSGKRRWEPFACNTPLVDALQLGRNSVFQYARGDGLYAIDVATGRLRWKMPEARIVLGVAQDDSVYLLDQSRNLRIVDGMLGKVKTTVPLTGFDLFVSNAKLPAVFVATSDGRIFCIRPKGAPRLDMGD